MKTVSHISLLDGHGLQLLALLDPQTSFQENCLFILFNAYPI